MNFHALIIFTLAAINLSESYKTIKESLHLKKVIINENFESNIQIANLTRLIYTELTNDIDKNDTIDSAKIFKIDYVRLNTKSKYFYVESKEISFDNFLINKIDLYTTKNKIDREIVCPFKETCILNLKFTIKLHEVQDIKRSFYLNCTLPIKINDMNDNLPSFFQDKIKIEMDLDNSPVWSSGIIKIPLKVGYDLDSTKSNRILNYSLQPMSTGLFCRAIKFIKSTDGILIILNITETFKEKIKSKPIQKFQLIATDGKNYAHQNIEIHFLTKEELKTTLIFQENFYNLTSLVNQDTILLNISLKSLNKFSNYEFSIQQNGNPIIADFFLDKNNSILNIEISSKDINFQLFAQKFKLIGKCTTENFIDISFLIVNLVDSSQRIVKDAESSVYLNIVSALNNLDINQTLENSAVYELRFHNLKTNSTNDNKEFVTIAYLIGSNSKASKSDFSLDVFNEATYLNDLFVIEEMRNGLYALKLKNSLYDRICKSKYIENESDLFYFKIGLKLFMKNKSKIDSRITRFILFKISKVLILEIISTTESSKSYNENINKIEVTTLKTETNHQKISSFLNSFVLITILSVILIFIGLACFVVSLTFYAVNKFRSKKARQLNKCDKKFSRSIFDSSQLIDNDTVSNSESGIASETQTRSTSSSSASSFIQQSLRESLGSKHIDELNEDQIMVYDVMPSQQLNQCSSICNNKKLKPNIIDRIYRKTNEIFLSRVKITDRNIYSISRKPEISNLNDRQNLPINNVSTLTNTNVTSPYNDSISKQKKKIDITSLYQMQDDKSDELKKSEKDIIYEWFMHNLNHSERRKSSQLVSVSSQSVAPSISSISTPKTNMTIIDPSLNEAPSNYRNEIYRNSHLILKNYSNSVISGPHQLIQNHKNKTAKSKEDSDITIYEARLMDLKEMKSRDELIINQNSKLDQNYFDIPPPPMPPARLDSYILTSDEMNNLQNFVKSDDDGLISSV